MRIYLAYFQWFHGHRHIRRGRAYLQTYRLTVHTVFFKLLFLGSRDPKVDISNQTQIRVLLITCVEVKQLEPNKCIIGEITE